MTLESFIFPYRLHIAQLISISLAVYISVAVFIYPSQYIHIPRRIYISVAVFIYPLQYLHIPRRIYILVAVLIYPSPYLYICRSIYISVAVFTYPSQYLYIRRSIYKYSGVQQFWHKRRPIVHCLLWEPSVSPLLSYYRRVFDYVSCTYRMDTYLSS